MKMNWPDLGFRCLLLAGAAVAVLPASAQLAPGASAAARSASISTVEVAQPGPQTTVRISGTGELHYRASRLDAPPRLVLDFADTRLSVEKTKIASEFAPVLDVRLGQPAPGQSRIVIDLANAVDYSTRVNGSDITIFFPAPAPAVTPASTSSALQPARKAAQHKLTAVNAPNMPLPAWLTGSDAGFARPADEPSAPVAVRAPQNPPAAESDTQTPATMSEKKYTGDPISVNLKDVDLKDFFRLIHEISGLNVVLDPSVKGTVTLVLDEVPWDQGLDIVLRNNGLTKEIDGNVLRIATQDTLKREADQKRELAKAQSDAIDTVTVTRVLSYAQALTMVNTVKKFMSPRGDVFADVRSNTLIIRDIPSWIPKIDNLLRQIDRKSQQVEIDARVVQTSRTFAREIGTEFGFSAPTGATGNTAFGGLAGLSTFVSPIVHSVATPFSTGSGATNSIPLNTNLGATAPNSGFSFATQGHNYAIDFLLSMMESRGVGKILSEPKGITQNNEKLTVKQGQQVPIQTNINNTISVQYVDAVLKLEVTPQITSEGTVFLDVTVENTQIDNSISVQGTPGLDTQSTQTKVLINDGGTVVIGGVVVTNQNTTINQVPLLGSVPIIGNLFKHTAISVSTQELMFFVTPRILPG
jgi:type IV pilus assembly protein PilQ